MYLHMCKEVGPPSPHSGPGLGPGGTLGLRHRPVHTSLHTWVLEQQLGQPSQPQTLTPALTGPDRLQLDFPSFFLIFGHGGRVPPPSTETTALTLLGAACGSLPASWGRGSRRGGTGSGYARGAWLGAGRGGAWAGRGGAAGDGLGCRCGGCRLLSSRNSSPRRRRRLGRRSPARWPGRGPQPWRTSS